METFSALLAICAGNSPVSGEFPTQRPVTRSFDVYFDLRPNKRLSKHSWGWWFETLSSPLWRHRNVNQSTPKRNGNMTTIRQHTTKLCFYYVVYAIYCYARLPIRPSTSKIDCRTSPISLLLWLVKGCWGLTARIWWDIEYRKVSYIGRTKCQNIDVSRLVLQLPFRNILKRSVKWRMKM